MSTASAPFNVLIAGGEVAWFGGALALRDLVGDRVSIQIRVLGVEHVYAAGGW